MKTRVTRRFQFCAGHRIYGHESKCNNVHGHNYVALITVEAPCLDKLTRVVDFGVIKEKYGKWIEEHWDHKMILAETDPMWTHLTNNDQPVCVMRRGLQPTAEGMATVLLEEGPDLLPAPLRVVKVRLWETENCYAEVGE